MENAPLPAALQEEFEALERASDEDFIRFEQGEDSAANEIAMTDTNNN